MKYDDNGNVDLKLINKVNDLQIKYGNRNCSCHPNYKWKIAVDILLQCGITPNIDIIQAKLYTRAMEHSLYLDDMGIIKIQK